MPGRILQRMLRACWLDSDLYEEVEADETATLSAAAVVVLSAVAAGIGSIENGGVAGIGWSAATAVLGWYVWAYVTYFIGTRWLPGSDTVSSHGELLRTIGFSSAPGILRVLALFSPVAGPVFWIATLWMFVAMVVAVRQALDYQSTGRAIAVCAIGFPVYAVTLAGTLLFLGPWPI